MKLKYNVEKDFFTLDFSSQVNELSNLEQFDFEEEEVLSDLSFDDELPSWEMPSN